MVVSRAHSTYTPVIHTHSLFNTFWGISQGKWFVSHQRAVSVWWQLLSGLASWKHSYLAQTQWAGGKRTLLRRRNILSRDSISMPEATAMLWSHWSHTWRNQICEVLRERWECENLSHFIPIFTSTMPVSILSSFCQSLRLSITNLYKSCKEGVHTLKQTAQHSQRQSQKS